MKMSNFQILHKKIKKLKVIQVYIKNKGAQNVNLLYSVPLLMGMMKDKIFKTRVKIKKMKKLIFNRIIIKIKI